MSAVSKAVYIVASKRTPFGSFGGSLKKLTAVELGVISTKAALTAGNVDPETVDSCFFGNVIASNNDAAYTARHIALKSGCKPSSTALTINRLCGSGFETVIQSVNAIQLGQAHICIAGGTEQMSQAPLMVRGDHARFGTPLGVGMKLTDSLWDGLTDAHAGIPMGITAENLAKKYEISRQDCDRYAILSQQRHKEAADAGKFNAELAPVTLTTKKGEVIFKTDEHARPESTFEKISGLKAVFQKDGAVTAANASGICDGAGTTIVASAEAVEKYGLKPIARIVSTAVTGCDPTIMGIGPVNAIKEALKKGGNLSLSDMGRIEINEAFAAQVLSCAKELELDGNSYNDAGGAIALGHPLGASGSRIIAHLANDPYHEYSIGSACIGGGQGIAVLLANP